MEQSAFNFDQQASEAQARRALLFKDVNAELLEKFEEFDEANPFIYEKFKQYAGEYKAMGWKHVSHWYLLNKVRYHTIKPTKGEDFKIPNDYFSLYARKLVWLEPQFEKFFELKSMKPDRQVPRSTHELYAHKLAEGK